MNRLTFIFSIVAFFALLGCRSEFERIRTSGDPELILEQADKLYEEGEYRQAITLYELVIPAYRGRTQAEEISYKFANAHFLNRSYILSAHYFKNFSDTYTSSPRREDAMYYAAFSHYKLSPKHKLDQSSSQKAVDAFQLFVNTYPESDKVAQVNDYIDDIRYKMELKAFDTGRLYYNMRQYNSAIQSLDNMLKDYPGSDKEEEAMYLLVMANLDLAANSIYTRQEERYNKTMDRIESYLKKYPNSNRSDQVQNVKNNIQEALKQIKNG